MARITSQTPARSPSRTGRPRQTFTVQILNPNKVEANKTFNVSLLQPSTNSYLVSPTSAVVVITNVNTGISFGSTSFSVSECSGLAAIPVVLTGVASGNTSVNFSTSDISGKAGNNYYPTNGTLYFTNGQTVQDFFVQVINNHIVGPNHTVQLSLSNPTNAQLLNPSAAILTIDECNGADIVASGTAFVTGSILPGTGAIYSNDVVTILFGLRDISGRQHHQPGGHAPADQRHHQRRIDGGLRSIAHKWTHEIRTVHLHGRQQRTEYHRHAGAPGRDAQIDERRFRIHHRRHGDFIHQQSAAPVVWQHQSADARDQFVSAGIGYPSLIDVTGIVGTVTAVTATLENFGHSYPQDINAVLEDPSGQTSILMSHAGSGVTVQHLNLTFDQSAAGYHCHSAARLHPEPTSRRPTPAIAMGPLPTRGGY